MKIIAPASAGTMESGDILIEIEPGEQRDQAGRPDERERSAAVLGLHEVEDVDHCGRRRQEGG